MQITIDAAFIFQLLSVCGSILVALCTFLWWVVRQVASETKKRAEQAGTMTDVLEEIKNLKDGLESGDDRFRRIEEAQADQARRIEEEQRAMAQRMYLLENKVVQRIEILETLKRTEQFFDKIVMELMTIIGHRLDIVVPDLSGPMHERQQMLDDEMRRSAP